MTPDDAAARIAALEAELHEARALHAGEVAALRERESATADVLRLVAASTGDLQSILDQICLLYTSDAADE